MRKIAATSSYIWDSIELVESRIQGDRERSFRDVELQDAVLWRLQTLAEATGKLSDTIKARHPETRWRAIYGFRIIAAHAYLDLQHEQVWEIIEIYLPQLKAVVAEEIARFG
jgi:uncharacterized protein with HEPN domain